MDEAAFRALTEKAATQHRQGDLVEAEAAYAAALKLAPEHPVVLHNLGVLAAASGAPAKAMAFFDRAIAREPRYASAWFNRATASQALGDTAQALRGFSQACAIEPDFYAAHRALGFLWLAQGDRGRALDHFARTYDLRRGENRTGIARKSLTTATRHKLRHDAGQLLYLSERRRDGKRFVLQARAYEHVADGVGAGETVLSEEDFEALGEDYNAPIAIAEAPELDPAVTPRPDHAEIASRFRRVEPGVEVIDDLLTPPALARLKRYLLESTIWHDFSHIGDFVASYLEDGLACPLVLQIADEIRAVFPELLGPHPLSQAWAFKGLTSLASVAAHADDAAFSINFWMTSEAANRAPERGGLVVCRTRPPEDWPVRDYHEDETRVQDFMRAHAAAAVTVPYRENRAVLFESRLFHRSDDPDFAPGYENHRINMTMLFGRT